MQAKITKVQRTKSKFGGDFFYVFFKDAECNSFKTCLYPRYRNFARWEGIIRAFFTGGESSEVWLDGLIAKGRLVNADSIPRQIPAPGKEESDVIAGRAS